MTPDWTDYSKRVTYQTYDVTALIANGENVLGALLGNGWYGGPIGLDHARFPVGKAPIRLSLEMRVTYKDGTELLVSSDENWKTASGPIIRSEIYNGETYDAGREPLGWNLPYFDDKEWSPVRVLPPVTIAIVAQQSPTIQATDTLVPTDCPQRDERLGWMADAQVFWRTVSYNMDMRSFTRKWMTDVRD